MLRDLTAEPGVFHAGGVVAELSAQSGAPGMPWTKPPLALRYGDILVEYRVRGSTGPDRGLPDPGRWIVVHSSPADAPVAELVQAVPATPGGWAVCGTDNVLDLFHDGPLQILVMSVDEAAGTARIAFSRRRARPLEQQGVGAGDGVLVFVPGVGFKPIPPHSPLVGIVEKVAAVHILQQAQRAAANGELPALAERTRDAVAELAELADRTARLSAGPVRSPLEEALSYITELRQNGTRPDPARLAAVEAALAAAATER